ncbi:hypothetical protein AB0O47_40450, partial [Streptomyces noursei]
RGDLLIVALTDTVEIRISATRYAATYEHGQYDRVSAESYGFVADEHEKIPNGETTYVYATGNEQEPRSLMMEAERVARAVNATIRGRCGVASAFLIAAPVVRLLAGPIAGRLEAQGHTILRKIVSGGRWEMPAAAGTGVVLGLSPVSGSAMGDLTLIEDALRVMLDEFEGYFTSYGVTLRMVDVAHGRVHDAQKRVVRSR